MKRKLLLMAVSFALVIPVLASDVIVKTNSQQIDAKILEVSKSEIRYKEADNLDGPVFVLSTDEISTITYSNGKKVSYHAAENGVSTLNEGDLIIIYTLDGKAIQAQLISIDNDKVVFVFNGIEQTLEGNKLLYVSLPNGQEKNYNRNVIQDVVLTPNYFSSTSPTEQKIVTSTVVPIQKQVQTTQPIHQTVSQQESKEEVQQVKYITRAGNTYFYNGRGMKGSVYSDFLFRTCPQAYEKFHQGRIIAGLGWGFFSVGLGLDIAGSVILLASGYGIDEISAPFLVIGSAFEIACIPTLIVGHVKMHNSAEVFNSNCAKTVPQSRPYWSINVTPNRLGLALNF